MQENKYDIIIAGGGLAGLISAICLARSGLKVMVAEKKTYPFHRVCGEYISNEVLPLLSRIGADPAILNPSGIHKLLVTSPGGYSLRADLPMGGFGVSRFRLDHFLYQIALDNTVDFELGKKIVDIGYDGHSFHMKLDDGSSFSSDIMIGAFGKRSNLDKSLNRQFFYKRSPYVAVKYHIRTNFPQDYIALHNFRDGYCGISAIEDGKYCLCYMTSRQSLRNAGSVPALEEKVLFRNPHLKEIFSSSEFLYEKPEVINEICFDKKEAVHQHIMMAGDSAGMIAPLCGNGMAMAIHGAKIMSELIVRHYKTSSSWRTILESEYTYEWNKMFASRLSIGRNLQKLFGNEILTDITVRLLQASPDLTRWIVRQTHGDAVL